MITEGKNIEALTMTNPAIEAFLLEAGYTQDQIKSIRSSDMGKMLIRKLNKTGNVGSFLRGCAIAWSPSNATA